MDEYQPVEERLKEFLDRFRAGRVITHLVSDPGAFMAGDVIIFRAELYRGDELRDTPPAATGYAHQRILAEPPKRQDGSPNWSSPEWTSPWEVAETSAVGRALANAGFNPKGQRPSFEEIRKAPAVPQAQAGVTGPASAENEATRASTAATSEGVRVARQQSAPSDDTSEAVSGGGYGEGQTLAPASDDLAALLEAVGGSETKAVNAINKAMHTNHRKADLESLDPEAWQAGLQHARGSR